jgi:hypothetical protein
VLEHLAEEFLHALSCGDERFPTGGRRPVHAPAPSAFQPGLGSKQTSTLHPVENRIHRARTHAVAVTGELVDHRLPEDRIFCRVVEHVQANQANVERSIKHRFPMSCFDIEIRSLA